MKRAVKLPQYSDAKEFHRAFRRGHVQLDKVTNLIATPSCPQDYTVAFIAGTEPKQSCDQATGDHRGFFTKIFGLGSPPVAAPPPNTNGAVVEANPGVTNGQTAEEQTKKKKRGFFSRLFGKGDSGDEEQNNGTNAGENGNNPNPK